MKLIKLSAIDSTNDFLKELSKAGSLENFTVVCTDEQTKGKGQMGSTWMTEKGKNLIMSMFISDFVKSADELFHLNVAVSIAIIEVLKDMEIENLSIKWPNDILSHDKKIAGILIENRFKSDMEIESVVGIGLNVNQLDFAGLPKASSLAVVTGREFDVQMLLMKIATHIQKKCETIQEQSTEQLWQHYLDNLFKKDMKMRFEDNARNQFTATIVGVSNIGKLELMLEDKSIQQFEIKEITMLY